MITYLWEFYIYDIEEDVEREELIEGKKEIYNYLNQCDILESAPQIQSGHYPKNIVDSQT